jgi:hypothetical protein
MGTVCISNVLYKNPINSDPIIFTKNVPLGKFIVTNLLTNNVEKYLNKAPAPPPIIITI